MVGVTAVVDLFLGQPGDLAHPVAVTRDRAVAAVTAVLVGGVLLLSVAVGIAAALLRAGHATARVVLVLLAVLTAVEIVLVVDVVSPLVVALLVAGVALGVVGMMTMYRPSATRWLLAARR